jgi:cell division protein FtsX
MFLILEFAACFIAVCLVVAATLAVCGLGYALILIARKSAGALHSFYRTRLHLQEAAKLSSTDITILVPALLADCAL